MIYTTAMPCDRGVPNNVTARGYHNFVAGQYGTVCTYCGKHAEHQERRKTTGPPYFMDVDAPDGGARQGQDER